MSVVLRQHNTLSPVYSYSVQAEITLLDVNDSSPEFSQSTYTAECSEAAGVGFTVTTVTASDADEDAQLSYSLSTNTSPFTINNQGMPFQSFFRHKTDGDKVLTIIYFLMYHHYKVYGIL